MPELMPRITACILARNEGSRIEGAIKCLQGWTVQIIVIDNESDDDTVEIARRYTPYILSAPRAANFDALRELAIDHAIGEWIFFLDADERVPPAVVPVIQRLIIQKGDRFNALTIPFKNYFCGKWIEHSGWWPGYTRPQLLRKGKFRYGERLHSGVTVDGETMSIPPRPDLAIDHYSYDDLTHYLAKLNRYTDGEAENLLADEANHTWQSMLAQFVFDWQMYYERGRGDLDGMHGFVLAFMSGAYRFISRAKLWDLRRRDNDAAPDEPAPGSVREMLEFMATVSQEGPARWLRAKHTPHSSTTISAAPGAEALAAPPILEHPSVRITACILARNESTRIKGALESLQGWTDQIIVIDNESEDDTAAIAARYTSYVLTAPRTDEFDSLRNLAIEHAEGDWIFYLDADERVPPMLGPVIRNLIATRGAEFDALCVPFRNYFYGKWMQSGAWWPGYKGPQLYRKGKFRYNDRVHSSAQVDGRVMNLPADDPELAISHYAYDDIGCYLSKLNAYTDQEARNMDVDGRPHDWRAMLAHFVHDWQVHYDQHQAWRDGMHGFVQSFLCSFYRFTARAKLWDLRRKQGMLTAAETVPGSLREMLEFMARVTVEGPAMWLQAPPPSNRPRPNSTPVLWRGPIFDASGYADDGRNLILSLIESGEDIELLPESWSPYETTLTEQDDRCLKTRVVTRSRPADVLIHNTLPTLLRRDPDASCCVARTVFETDRLPDGWAENLNQWDRIWVPTEFNRASFVRGGVDAAKIAVVPEAIDADLFAGGLAPWPMPGAEPYKFLSIFDWSLHKGWDVLLEAFARVYGGSAECGLFIKTWSSLNYTIDDIRKQADDFLRDRLGFGLDAFPNIHIWSASLSASDMPRLYHSVDCFVIPTRCDGWCRPLMEAMASGLPTIATAWSGPAAFHDAKLGYPLKYAACAVSEAGARELPVYKGHDWAEPDVRDLQRLLKHVVKNRAAAARKGLAARKSISENFSRAAVAAVVRRELTTAREIARRNTVASAAESASAAKPARVPARQSASRKAILIQSAAGDHVRLLDLTRNRHTAYARAHDMDFVCRPGPQQTERRPNWDKIALVLQALKKGEWEYVIWLDSDTLIADMNRDLREALPEGAWLGMVRHGNPAWFNSGALYVRNTPESLAFFEEVWNTYPVDHDWEDNMAIIRVLGFNPSRWSGVAVIGDEWNSTRLMNEVPNPVVKAWHGSEQVPGRLLMMERELRSLEQRGLQTEKAPSKPGLLMPPANLLQAGHPSRVDFRALLGRPLRVRWEGNQNVLSSLAQVNRELCFGLLEAGDVELTIDINPREPFPLSVDADPRFERLFSLGSAELSGPPDITVRHHFPPNWSRPAEGRLVVMQPWETSHLPEDWVQAATSSADQVWANSRFVRDVYVRSGVPAEKVLLAPEGICPEVFKPRGEGFSLPAKRGTSFLFVGGTIHRKGADILLQAYLGAFKPDDDVCLIVKDMGTKTFYRGQTLTEAFRRAQANLKAPRVIYLEDDLPEARLAALYREATCLVLPYRGEGFGLPPLEAMACGTPAVVTAGGATDDYVGDATGFRLPYRRHIIPPRNGAPAHPSVQRWDLEPDVRALAATMRWIYDHPEEVRRRGAAAAEYVEKNWTWRRSVAAIREHMAKLVDPPAKSIIIPATAWPAASAAKPGKRSRSMKPAAAISISLCMIVRDEAAHLAECLKSIKPYVDEMVIVDTGSTDRTREIALEQGARVYDFAWTDSFADARNQSLDLARGEWIFWMDADDVISPECGARLRDLVSKHPNKDAAYQMYVQIPPGPDEHSPSLVDHVKLFPNRPDVRFEHRIHEQIIPSLRRAGIAVNFSDLYVTHLHYDRSPEGQAKKRERDFRLLHLDLIDRPEHPFTLFNFGMTYLFATRDYEVAAHYLTRCLRGSDWRDSIIRKVYALVTTARICQQDWPLAIRANEEGRSYYPDDAELLYQAGQLYQKVDRMDEARLALERLIGGTEGAHYRSVAVGLRTFRGLHELAALHERSGDVAGSVKILTEIARDYPDYLPAQADLQKLLQSMQPPLRNEADTIEPPLTRPTGGARRRNRSEVQGRPLAADGDGIIDCLDRAIIQRPASILKAARCIATVVTPSHLGLATDMLRSLQSHGNCPDALVVAFCVDGDEKTARAIEDHGAVPIMCTSRGRVNQTIKSVLYSIADVVQAGQFLCLDADILVTSDLSPIFSMLDACPRDRILVARDAFLSSHATLGEALTGFYQGSEGDIGFLLGRSPNDEARYPIIINDGVFAGSAGALARLDRTIRGWAPRSLRWVDNRPDFGCRNQFVFNLTLAHLDCAVEIDETFNWQVQVRNVAISLDQSGSALTPQGHPIRALHFCGSGRPKQAEYRSRFALDPVKSASKHVPGRIDLAVVTIKREDDYFHATIDSMHCVEHVDVIVGSADTDYLERYRNLELLTIRGVDSKQWATVKDQDVPRKAGWNYWRAMTLASEHDRGIAIFEDDLQFGKDWRRRMEDVVVAAEAAHGSRFVLSLYCTYGFIAERENRGRLILDYPIDVFAGFQAMYYPSKVRREFAAYLKEHGVDSYRTHHDLLIKDFLLENSIPLMTTSPSLVQHVGYKTTGFGACHMSPLFLDGGWPTIAS